jgi:hypothetical protein
VDDARVANRKLHSIYDSAFDNRVHGHIFLTARISKNIWLTVLEYFLSAYDEDNVSNLQNRSSKSSARHLWHKGG